MATNFDDIIQRYRDSKPQLGETRQTAAPSPTAPAAAPEALGEAAPRSRGFVQRFEDAVGPQRNAITWKPESKPLLGGEGASSTSSVYGSFYESGAKSIAAIPRAINEFTSGVANKVVGSDIPTSENDFLEKIASGIERGAARIAAPNPQYQDLVTSKLASGLGSTVGVAAGTAVGGVPGGMAAGAAAIGVEGVEDYKESIERLGGEYDADKAFNTFLANSALGTTEALPIMSAFNRLDKATGGQLDNKIGEILKGGAEEAVQEGFQTLASNWIASDLVAYDAERNVFEDTAEAAALGGGVGLILNTIIVAAGMDPVSFKNQAREKGPIESAVTDNGVSVPVDAAAETEALQEQREEQAKTNPITGDPLATKEVSDIQLFYQEALDSAAAAPTEEDKNFFEAEARKYKARLEEVAKEPETEEGQEPSAADIKATTEAKEVLATLEAELERSPDSATNIEAPDERIIETDDINQRESERLAALADVQLPESESTGGFFTEGASPAAEAAVEATEDAQASAVWDAMTRTAPATDEQLATFQRQYPEWYQVNVENPTTIIADPESVPVGDTNEATHSEPLESVELEIDAAADGTPDPAVEPAPEVIRAASGRPYKTEQAARVQLNRRGLQETHEITQEADGGYVLAPRAVQEEVVADVPTEAEIAPVTEEEAETVEIAEEAVAPVEDIPAAPIEEADPVLEESPEPVDPSPAREFPRQVPELLDDIEANGIQANLDEIVKDYGSVKAFQDVVNDLETLPASLQEQAGLGIDENTAEAGDFNIQEEAGFDPETDIGDEAFVASQEEAAIPSDAAPETPPVQTPKRKLNKVKAEVDNVVQTKTREDVIASLEEQIETALNEGKDTSKLELALDIKQREVARLAKEAARIEKVKKGKVKKASDKEVDDLVKGIESGDVDLNSLDVFDEFALDDDDFSYIFAGVTADTASGSNLIKAAGSLSIGRDANQVRKETGWFVGPDNEFRFEIDDSKAKLKNLTTNSFGDSWEAVIAETGRRPKLGDFLDHPALFEAYPELVNINLTIDSDMSPMEGGISPGLNRVMDEGGEVIETSYHFNMYLPDAVPDANVLLDTILHEVQHAVQYMEGFAVGGQPEMFTDHYQKQLAQRSQWRSALVDKEYAAWGNTSSRLLRPGSLMPKEEVYGMMQELSKADPEYRKLLERMSVPIQTDYDLYMNLAGEVEARDVSARRMLSLAERADSLPAMADDVAIADVLIRRPEDNLESLIAGLERSESRMMPNGVKRYKHKPEEKSKIQASIDKFNTNSDSVNIVAVDTISALPARVKRDLLSKMAKGAEATSVQGVFDDKNNAIYIITNAVGNAKEAEVVLMHELVGHYGVKKTFEAAEGDANAYNNMLDKESKRNPELMRQAAELVYKRGYKDLFLDAKPEGYSQKIIIEGQAKYLTSDSATTVLDEFIAFKAEEIARDPAGFKSQYGSFRKRLISAIRHMFSKLGFGSNKLTEEDIFAFIAESNARLFDLNNSSVIGFLQKGRGIRYNLAKYTDPQSAKFLPDAARTIGVAPAGSFNRERIAAEAFEANLTPLQKKAKDQEEANDERSLRSVLNLVQSGFGKTTVNKWEAKVDAGWQKVMKNPFMQKVASFGPLGSVSHKEVYRALQAVARGQVAKAETKANRIDKVLKKFTPAQKKLTMEFFTTRDADPAIIEGISASDRQALSAAKQDLIDLGQQLVDMGKLSPKVYLESKGMYLPKVYYKYINSFGASGKRTSFMSYLRKQKEITREQAVDLGKIEDPGIIVPETIGTIGRDIALMRLTSNIVNTSVERNLGWVIGETFKVKYVNRSGKTTTASLYDLQEEVDRMQKQYAEGKEGKIFQMTEADLASLGERINYVDALIVRAEEGRAAEITEMLQAQGLTPEQITPDVVSNYMKENYTDMPVDAAYGSLSGKKVMKSIRSDFVNNMGNDTDIEDSFQNIWRGVETGHQYWKASKVVLNVPVSTVRNATGNFVLLDTSTNTNAGKLLTNLGDELANAWKGNPSRFWKYAEETGLMGTTFSATELNRIKRSAVAELEHALKVEKAKGRRGAGVIIASAKGRRLMSLTFNLAAKFYGGQEGLFKVGKMRDFIETWEKQNNMSVDDLPWAQKEAVLLQGSMEASSAIFDYSEVPGFINVLRRTPFLGSPFVTFTYKSLLKMPENFAKHPQKFAKYAAATSTMLMSALGAMHDDEWDDEEVDEVMATMADYYQNSTAVVLVPWKDGNGNLQIVDFTPFFPWASHTNFMKGSIQAMQEGSPMGAIEGIGSEFLDWSGFLSTPADSIITTLKTNTDPFTGREISPTGASGGEKLEAWSKYIWSLAMPPILTEQGALGHFLDNMGVDMAPFSQGRALNRLGDDRETIGQVGARVFGVNAIPQNRDLNRANTIAARNAEIRTLETRRGQIQRDRNIQSTEERALKVREVQERIKQTHEKYRARLNGTGEQ